MLKYSLLILALLQVQASIADDNSSSKFASSEEITKLVDRIEQLEKKIKELERQIAKPPNVANAPQYQPYGMPHPGLSFNQPYYPIQPGPPSYMPSPGQSNPSDRPNVPSVPYSQPYSQSMPHQPMPFPQPMPNQQPYQQNKGVPESWKPFNFNGAQYYIIPVDEADRMSRRQGNEQPNR